MNIFFQKPKRVVYFCQYYNEKGLKVDFVSLPAWQWIILADCFWTNESAHMKCIIHLCGIFWKMIFVNVRFFVNFVTSVYPFDFFLCHFTLVYRRWAKKPKRKMGTKLCLFHQPGQGWLFFCFFVFKGNFLTKLKEYIIYFFISPLNSQIKFVILLNVNHTILIMLVQRI